MQKNDSSKNWIRKPSQITIRICTSCKIKKTTKDGRRMKTGLYANINAKKKRIAAGSGEKMNKVGSKNAPTAKDFKQAAKTAKPMKAKK